MKENLTHRRSFFCPIIAESEDKSELKVKIHPSGYHTTICHVHLGSGSSTVWTTKPSHSSCIINKKVNICICVWTAVESVKLNVAGSSAALLIPCWQAVQTQLKGKSKFKHQSPHLDKKYSFISFQHLQSDAPWTQNLQISLRLKPVRCFSTMPADKPLVGSCEGYSNVAFRAGAGCSFLHSSGATCRQRAQHQKNSLNSSLNSQWVRRKTDPTWV